jgi:hypothetical protein
MNTEVVLASIPGASDEERLVVVHTRNSGGESVILLRQQTWGEGVGWFDQSTVSIEPEQLGQLRMALGGTGAGYRVRPNMRATESPHLRLAQAESA